MYFEDCLVEPLAMDCVVPKPLGCACSATSECGSGLDCHASRKKCLKPGTS